MARVSKYQKMVGQMVNEVLVSDYHRLEKISAKSGRKYFRYEVELDNLIWVSTTSFNKGTYGKRLAKAKGQGQGQGKAKRTTKKDEKIFTEFGWFTKAEYKKIKEAGRVKAKAKEDLDKVWKERLAKEQLEDEIRNLNDAAYFGKESAKRRYEHFKEMFKDENNMNVYGQTMYHSKEDFFSHWNDNVIKRYESEIKMEKESMENNVCGLFNWAFKVAALNEWLKEFSQKFWEFVQDEWENIEQRRHKAQKEWRDKHYGKDWEERWERQNFGKTTDYRTNEYDEQFKGLNAKEAKRLMRQLSKQLHPDLNPGINDKGFKDMMAAYDRHMARVA